MEGGCRGMSHSLPPFFKPSIYLTVYPFVSSPSVLCVAVAQLAHTHTHLYKLQNRAADVCEIQVGVSETNCGKQGILFSLQNNKGRISSRNTEVMNPSHPNKARNTTQYLEQPFKYQLVIIAICRTNVH